MRNRGCASPLLLEIIGEVRAALGPGRALGVRICGDELTGDGITLDEAVAVARLVARTGEADYINTSIGVATSTLYMIVAGMRVPPGYAMHIPAAIRRAVPLPVIGAGRFTDPEQAERALAGGRCDLVGVVRGQIADPAFAAKARAGQAAAIRTCLSCNQECVGRVGRGRWLGCIQNPRAGKEARPAGGRRPRRRVYVAGGGPGGLQTAVTAASRGHQVTLFERAERTGGQVLAAAAAPGRAGFGDLVWNMAAHARGIRQLTEVVVLGCRPGRAGGLLLDLLRHPAGGVAELACDWVVTALPPEPADGLWHELKGAPFEVHRVGDCLAPRRAHAAVIEGERVGAAL